MYFVSSFILLHFLLATLKHVEASDSNVILNEYDQEGEDGSEVEDNSKAESSVLSFLIIGDWGKGGESGNIQSQRYLRSRGLANDNNNNNKNSNNNNKNGNSKQQGTNQVAVAKSMAQYAANSVIKPSFVVALGDNFYTKGVYSTSDVLWQYLWSDIYLQYDSLKSIPWYAVLGNHDYGYGATGVQAQIDRTQTDPLWRMPALNYTKRFQVNDISVQIIFIDTTTLAPSENSCCNSKG